MQLLNTDFLKVNFQKYYKLLENFIEIGYISVLRAVELDQSRSLEPSFLIMPGRELLFP